MKKGTTLTKTIQVKDEAIQTYDNKLELKQVPRKLNPISRIENLNSSIIITEIKKPSHKENSAPKDFTEKF